MYANKIFMLATPAMIDQLVISRSAMIGHICKIIV